MTTMLQEFNQPCYSSTILAAGEIKRNKEITRYAYIKLNEIRKLQRFAFIGPPLGERETKPLHLHTNIKKEPYNINYNQHRA